MKVAAGGIADGRGLAAILAMGAAGVWMGTRFLASHEAAVHPVYKEKVLQAAETDTVYSSVFDAGWPDAPHRSLRNSSPRETSRNWPSRGGAMSEAAFHELEHLSPDRKYEYLNGLAYLTSGGSVAHDCITRNVGYALDSQLRSGPCRAFAVDVQVLLGTKKDRKKHYAYLVADDGRGRATALFDRVAIVATGTPVRVIVAKHLTHGLTAK